MSRHLHRRLTAICLMALWCAGCMAGPNYRRPVLPLPVTFKEAATAGAEAAAFQPAQPADDRIRSPWWEGFNDPLLTSLEQQASTANQTVAQAEAAFRSARAAIRGARADLFPTATAGGSAIRSRASSNRVTGVAPGTSDAYQLSFDFSYEADLWGRVRRNVEASVANAQASSADLQTARLSVAAELAVDYFDLKGIDAQIDLLHRTVDAYERAVTLTTARFTQGVASGIDVAQAQTQLDSTRAQATDLIATRAQLEHAIATLSGEPPSELSIAPDVIESVPPVIPVSLPSRLVERRPDVAGAERRVASANALIGVAKAAYFPTLSLTGTAGVESALIGELLALPSRVWSIGPALVETIFDGGRRRSLTDQAVANYDETVAAYRQSALTAFQDVEDNLAELRVLGDEATEASAAAAAASRALGLANAQYAAGIVSYLQVITAQTAALATELTEVQIRTRRMTASVLLVKALGGGWSDADVPTRQELIRGLPSPLQDH